MTLKEIRKYLDDTKVYVNGKSREIQEKLFTFGYKWQIINSTEVSNIERPFLFIYKEGDITCTNNMCEFAEHKNREISADEILSLEITEPSYRPFESQAECFEEMKKHIPFGWLKNKYAVEYDNITSVCGLLDYKSKFENYTFADGTPFGIKED